MLSSSVCQRAMRVRNSYDRRQSKKLTLMFTLRFMGHTRATRGKLSQPRAGDLDTILPGNSVNHGRLPLGSYLLFPSSWVRSATVVG